MVDVLDDMVSGGYVPASCIGDDWIIKELERLKHEKERKEQIDQPRVYIPVRREYEAPDESEGSVIITPDDGDVHSDFEIDYKAL